MTENTFLNPKKQPFMCGVCEGFYGKPWTFGQRQELFKRMQRFGMNAYLYAPKDDYKHRLYWRDLYTDEEAEELRSLIREAEERNVRFIYAISPGLDIVYSSALDVMVLKKKLEQVKNLGCQNFALLFDDIEDELCSEDMTKFASIADAQCFMTNDIYNYLNQPHLFLFCPTEYCSSRSLPDVLKSTYLKTVGLRLDPRIEFLWTGPKVVSRRITVENVSEVGLVVRRQVTLWDNLHANDYDQTRLYLGPYSGRPTELLGCLRGVLTNPNCEFEANYIALHTLAQWSCNKVTRFPVTMASPTHGEADMEVEEEEVVESSYEKGGNETQASATSSKPVDTIGYDPRKALQSAVADWLPELYKTKSPFGQHLSSSTIKGYFAPATSSPNDNKVKLLGEEARSMEEYYEEKVHDLDLESDGAGKELEEEMKKIDEDVPMTAADEVGGRREEEEDEERLKSALREAMASSEAAAAGLKKQSSIVGYQQQQSSQSVVGGFYYDYRKRQHDASLTGEEVTMICDFFYLPFEHGPSGDEMLRAATWLVDNFDIVYRAAPFSCYGGSGTGQRLTSFVPQLHLSDSLSPYSSSPPNSPISDRTTSPPPPPPPPILTQSNVAATTTGASLLKPDRNVVFINASISNSTTLVGSTGAPTAGRTPKTRFVQDTYLSSSTASEWYERAIRFHDGYGDLSAVVDKLVNIPNRELLYELYKYVNDMRSNLALVNSYIKWHGIDKREKELFKSGEQEPWVHRGGLLAEFRRLLPFDRESPHGRNPNVLIVRPFYTKDRVDINSVCLRTYNDTMDASYWLGTMPNLVGDCKIGAFLQYFSKYCFVLEDDLGVCGYVVASDNVKNYRSHLEKTWLPEMRLKYPIIETIADKKPTTTTSTNESTAGMSSEPLGEVDPPINQSDKVLKEEEMSRQESEERQEDACPMSSSEQSRSPSPTNYCPTFSVLDSIGADRMKSQALSIEALLKALHADHKPVLKEDCNLFLRYPSPISIGLLYGKGSAAKLLLASVEQALANAGSQGMHVILPANHKASIDLYKRLGFREERAESGEGNQNKMDDSNKDTTAFEAIGPEDAKKDSGFDPLGSVILCKPIIPAPEGDGYQSVGCTLGQSGIRQFLSQQQVNLGEQSGASQGSVCSSITISTTAATLGSVGSMESGEASDNATLEQQKL